MLLNQGFKAVDMSAWPLKQWIACFNGFDYCKVIEVAACENCGVSKIIGTVFYSVLVKELDSVCSNGFESSLSMSIKSEFIFKLK